MKTNFKSILGLSLFVATALSVTACGTGHFSKAATASPLTAVGAPTALNGRWQSACDPATAIMITWDFAGAAFRQTTEGYPLGNNCNDDPTTSTVKTGTFSISNANGYSGQLIGSGSYSSLNLAVSDGSQASAAFMLNGSDLQISSLSAPGNLQVNSLMDFVKITDGS